MRGRQPEVEAELDDQGALPPSSRRRSEPAPTAAVGRAAYCAMHMLICADRLGHRRGGGPRVGGGRRIGDTHADVVVRGVRRAQMGRDGEFADVYLSADGWRDSMYELACVWAPDGGGPMPQREFLQNMRAHLTVAGPPLRLKTLNEVDYAAWLTGGDAEEPALPPADTGWSPFAGRPATPPPPPVPGGRAAGAQSGRAAGRRRRRAQGAARRRGARRRTAKPAAATSPRTQAAPAAPAPEQVPPAAPTPAPARRWRHRRRGPSSPPPRVRRACGRGRDLSRSRRRRHRRCRRSSGRSGARAAPPPPPFRPGTRERTPRPWHCCLRAPTRRRRGRATPRPQLCVCQVRRRRSASPPTARVPSTAASVACGAHRQPRRAARSASASH